MFRKTLFTISILTLSACGAAYISPSISEQADGKVRVLPLTSETVLAANQSQYRPKTLPAVFFQNAGGAGAVRGAGPTPEPASLQERRPVALETRIPPAMPNTPYEIGVGDVVLLATKSGGGTVAELSGLLAAQNSRQGYTIQDLSLIHI